MNRFRTRRRAKEQQRAESPSPSIQDSFHGISFKSKSLKQKPPSPELKTVDISSVLPSSNEFRTSLMMPNLSARFSMLREQDDPTTKIGKANDDSVLFPRRASRLNLFSHNPLTDIAETDSIRDSIRPPFAGRARTNSVDTDGYDSDGGSIIGRSRRREGNNLFGGRQKLYKIPSESSASKILPTQDSPRESSSGMTGRVMYENDVSLSLFQKHRERERAAPRLRDGGDSPDGADDESPPSPATSLGNYRATTSSTNSAPRRDSTAATSVASQSPSLSCNNASTSVVNAPKPTTSPKPAMDRNATVYRKLYGQALNQPKSFKRVKNVFENFNRPRLNTNERKDSTEMAQKSPPDQADVQSVPPLFSLPSSTFRSASPPPPSSPSVVDSLDAALQDPNPPEPNRSQRYGLSQPLSPPVSDGEDNATFVQSLQPEDRGKATAMGLFNKPRREYDEQQFSQRQCQMHQERSAPQLDSLRSATPVSIPASSDRDLPSERKEDPQKHTSLLAETAESQEPSIAADLRSAPLPMEVRAPDAVDVSLRNEDAKPCELVPSTSFLDDADPSEGLDESLPQMSPQRSPYDTHPAYRPVVHVLKDAPLANTQNTPQIMEACPPVSTAIDDQARSDRLDPRPESPVEGLGLSGLIRTHLRHDSDKSSIYRPVSSQSQSAMVNDSLGIRASPSTDQLRSANGDHPAQRSVNHLKIGQNTEHGLIDRNLLRNPAYASPTQRTKDLPALPSQMSENNRNWNDDVRSKHQRDGSTETQHEREAFNHELAQRRRKVQEKLRDVVECNSRPASPSLPAEEGPAKSPATGFSAMLRTKPGRSKAKSPQSFAQPSQEQPSKAMKVLGLGGVTGVKSTASSKAQDDLWREEEERMLEAFGRRNNTKPSNGPSPTKNIAPVFAKVSGGPVSRVDDEERSRSRNIPSPTMRSSPRDRSTSDVSSRSYGLGGRSRDDRDKAVTERLGSQARADTFHNSSTAFVAPRPPPIQAVEQPERSGSAMSGRFRSNSRSGTASYFDSKPAHRLQTADLPSPTSISTRPSPRTPYSAHSTPPIGENPPSSSNFSTTSVALLNQGPDDRGRFGGFRDRKRSITKNMISDPTFISTTYNVSTVDLPPGASLRNGSESAPLKESFPPALPLMNPARRRGRLGIGPSATQTLMSTLTGRSTDSRSDLTPMHSSGALTTTELRSGTPDQTDDQKPPSPYRPKHRLRKVSSEGGDLNSEARFQALMAGPSPAVPALSPARREPLAPQPQPRLPLQQPTPAQTVDGDMF